MTNPHFSFYGIFFLIIMMVFGSLISIPFANAQNSNQQNSEYVKSPIKQFLEGVVPKSIVCHQNLILVIKSSNGYPACVKESTAQKLFQSGWAVTETTKKSGTWIHQEDALGNIIEEGAPLLAMPSPGLSGTSQEDLGLSVGGSKDIANFRENIKNNFLPLPTDITYEGLFYDYYFDTGKVLECKKLFCPTYTYAISQDPFSKKDDYYLSVGLNSGLKQEDFQRKKLNLVIVLDISGSMSSPFDRYYYDQFGNKITKETNSDSSSKMTLANEAVSGLIDHLNDDDNLGVVLFTDIAFAAKPLESMKITDKEALKENILKIYPTYGTNMGAGLSTATALFKNKTSDSSEYENRIIFLTDAMPNFGDTSDSGLLKIIERNSQDGIYTTFIGIGVDLNTELIEKLTKVQGANYYSVHSSDEFNKRMIEEFDYIVTPLVFDLNLTLDASGYNIKQVYGSPEADESTGEIMKVSTLFPSKTIEGETRGGIILLKLQKTSTNGTLVLKTTYEDKLHHQDSDSITVNIDNKKSDFYENTGIHKGILLSRYADLIKTWIFDERKSMSDKTDITYPSTLHENGIYVPEYVKFQLGEWERQSLPLTVSTEYKNLFSEFNDYFKKETISIADEKLTQETEIMNKLSK